MILQKTLRKFVATAAAVVYISVSAFIFGTLRTASAAAATAKTTDYLNLRSGAGTNTHVVLVLGKNVTVTILDNSDSQWAKVKTSGGKTGYCFKQYLNFSGSPVSGPSASSSSGSGQASASTTANLNLRAGASLNGRILSILAKGTSLKIIDNSNPQWAKIQTKNGTQGWCYKAYLKISNGSNTPSVSASVNKSSGTTGTTTDYLNLREGAGMNYKVILTMSKGTSVSVLDTSNALWTKVRTQGGKQGWCSTSYLKISAPSSTSSSPTAQTPSGMTGTTTDYLNLREGANISNKVLFTMSKGTAVTILDNSKQDWVKVRTANGKEGWCSRQYLKISGGSSPKSSSSPQSSNPGFSVLPVSSKPASSSSASETSSKLSGTDQDIPSGNNGSVAGAVTSATVTASLLRLREGTDTNTKILDNLPRGTVLKVLDTSVAGWIKVQTSVGKTGYVSAKYVALNNGTNSGGTQNSNAAVSLSELSQSIPAGKTLFLKAATKPSGSSVSWSSSNDEVATVSNGYVYAAAVGTAQITAASGSGSASCNITVTSAEPVRTAYAAPNVAAPGETVTLTAVTDALRDGVRFSVSMPDGSVETVPANFLKQETTNGVVTKVWTGKTSFSAPGVYSFSAYSSQNSAFSPSGFQSSVLVSTQNDCTVTTTEQRRASDKIFALIAKWEGYSPAVYADSLAYSPIPTVGYGCTYNSNAVFYNNISKTEAWSLMVNRVNGSSYTAELNKMITNNHFLMSQNQADCLISFAYNVGSGYFNSSQETGFRQILKNAVEPPQISDGSSISATVTKDAAVRSNYGSLSAEICQVSSGECVDVTGSHFAAKNDGWYQVRFSDGTMGWINSGYVSLSTSDSLVHDLNYTNALAFGSELIRWNQAGGKFYTGLFYRRLGEANVFNYNDYNAVRYNKYNYTYPNSASSLQ